MNESKANRENLNYFLCSLRAINVREIEKYYKLVKNHCPRGMEWDDDLEICQELPNYKV